MQTYTVERCIISFGTCFDASLSHGAIVWAVKQKSKEITVSIRSSRNVHSECTRELRFTEV